MPSAVIVKRNELKSSFRVESIISRHELDPKTADFVRSVDIPIEGKDWSVGVICGSSGSGKSTTAKQLFPNEYIESFKYGTAAIIDEMPKECSIDEICKIFNSVGFGTVWNWIKPYQVLSCGEKMRVDLARAILEKRELVVFDEFTSVVDREIAKVASFSISKAIRKTKKRFIAVTCHRDIIEWLEPDWVYDSDLNQFFFVQTQSNGQSLRLKSEQQTRIFGPVLSSITI